MAFAYNLSSSGGRLLRHISLSGDDEFLQRTCCRDAGIKALRWLGWTQWPGINRATYK